MCACLIAGAYKYLQPSTLHLTKKSRAECQAVAQQRVPILCAYKASRTAYKVTQIMRSVAPPANSKFKISLGTALVSHKVSSSNLPVVFFQHFKKQCIFAISIGSDALRNDTPCYAVRLRLVRAYSSMRAFPSVMGGLSVLQALFQRLQAADRAAARSRVARLHGDTDGILLQDQYITARNSKGVAGQRHVAIQ